MFIKTSVAPDSYKTKIANKKKNTTFQFKNRQEMQQPEHVAPHVALRNKHEERRRAMERGTRGRCLEVSVACSGSKKVFCLKRTSLLRGSLWD